jgi:hypothetical protein
VPLLYTRERIEAVAEHRLVLQPLGHGIQRHASETRRGCRGRHLTEDEKPLAGEATHCCDMGAGAYRLGGLALGAGGTS